MAVAPVPGQVLRAFSDIGAAGANGLIPFYKPTPIAKQFHQDTSKFRLMRGGNQGGKTTTNCAETIYRLMGRHPYLIVPPAPVDGWVVCSSWKQSLIIMRKFHEMIPSSMLAESTHFTNKNGYSGKYVELINGSTLTFQTVNQDTVDLASATLHFVSVDEPPPEHVWGELVARISHYPSAVLYLTCTPIGRPVEWLREKVESGDISDHQFSLTEENCTPEGGIPFKTAEQIKAIEAQYLPIERAQRVHGSWEGISDERWIEAFNEGCISDDPPPGDVVLQVGVGVDHGAKAGRQSITLVFVGEIEGETHVWLWAEAKTDGRSSSDDDAASFIAMLRDQAVALSELDYVVGDRAHGGDWKGNQKSNRDLVAAIARHLKTPPYKLPEALRRISVPRKWQGSIEYGCRLINKLSAAGRFHVHPRCEGFIDAAFYWQGDRRDPRKDKIDSARYIVEKMVDAHRVFTSDTLPSVMRAGG